MNKHAALWILSATLVSSPAVGADAVDFNRDIRAILADNCYQCHGPDAEELQGDLRLDLRDDAVASAAIVSGKPEQSELVARIFSDDPDLKMPPANAHKKLSTGQKQLLRRWIAEGAEYQEHWAFIAPRRPSLPEVEQQPWVRNPIDRFVLAQLEKTGLQPAAEANRETLIRRVSLDLRGFPPSLAEIDLFLADTGADAYEKMVDRMLKSPHYGEKMARIWMDLARYGDTNGYHYDSTRQVWLWRDWVIDAYNHNMPFDQFTIEQLAGDLIPDATVDQKIASGFNRNTRYNEEGGADPEEWRVQYAKDRTNTLGQVWLGMTVQCGECHSHKYDPISQEEYYQLYAFFNSLDEPGAQGHRQKYPPLIEVPTAEQDKTLADTKAEIASLEKRIEEALAKVEYQQPEDLPSPAEQKTEDFVWIDDQPPAGASTHGDGGQAWNWAARGEAHVVHRGERALRRSGAGLIQDYFVGAKQPLTIDKETVLFAHVWLDPNNPPKTVQLQFNDGSWEHRAYWGENRGHGGGAERPGNHRVGDLPEPGRWVRLEVPAADVGLKPGAKVGGWAFTQFDGTVYYDNAGMTKRPADTRHLHSLALWESKAAGEEQTPAPVKAALKVPADNRNEAQQKTIRDHYLRHVYAGTRDIFEPLHKQLERAQKKLKETEEAIPFQLVSVELPQPRAAHMLVRGDFQKPGKQVQRDVPDVFPPLPEDQPKNRLGLAHWVVRPDHPLTARVTVNRYWAQLFGRGIVETVGDFGHLGRFPTHPDLLDWLAVEFVESGWDTKHIIKLMLMSAAYRQSPVNAHCDGEIDGDNKLLWHAPRFRLPAEEIRDSALKIAGLLSPKVGGPPVFPYQPVDYYKGKKGGWSWDLSQGANRYRRGMYTFWRRTTPYPTFVIFDAPDRSECVVSRARTNTPLQALATLNDPQFVEAARAFAERIMTEGSQALDGRLEFAFRVAVARPPEPAEREVLKATYEQQRAHYREHPEAAEQLVQGGSASKTEKLDSIELAAWTAVANVLLNLDETITRE